MNTTERLKNNKAKSTKINKLKLCPKYPYLTNDGNEIVKKKKIMHCQIERYSKERQLLQELLAMV